MKTDVKKIMAEAMRDATFASRTVARWEGREARTVAERMTAEADAEAAELESVGVPRLDR